VPTILHISTRLILGGSQENTVLSCEGQARLGHTVHLAFGPIYGPEGSLLDRVRAFNERCAAGTERVGDVGEACSVRPRGEPVTPISIHTVPDLIREVNPVRDARCLTQLRQLIRDLDPDVVHTHSSKAGILGRIAGTREARRRARSASHAPSAKPRPFIVHTIHGPPFMPIEGPPARRTKVRVNNLIYTLAERHAAKRCDVICSVADAMTRDFLARKIGTPDQYATVYSGMETRTYLEPKPIDALPQTRDAIRAALGLSPTDFVIGTVARLAEHKGHDDILDAIGQDLATHPTWKLLWVGDGWWRDRLLARVASLGLADRVITTGLVPSERVPSLMRAMDLLVHPSYREGLPRTIPQALLCATPVVATDVDGTSEVCLDPARVGDAHATGLLVPLGDHAKLRDAIQWMATHPAERARMAETGRALCAERFSTERMIAHLERIYFAD
jgi:glycosyltransferase involved in cell wall biosynthesis